MNYTTLEIDFNTHVATISLNRPAVRNAFNETAIAEITDAFTQLGAQADVRAIVLAARGSAFCAGADLNWMKKMADFSHEENLADAVQLADMLRTIWVCPKPVIAKVQGDCYAGGIGLVAAADIAVAAEGAHFSISEVRLGLIPATISPYVLRAIGPRAASRYFLSGERFTAAEALRIGLLQEVCAADVLDARVDKVLEALVTASPDAVLEAKRLVRDITGAPLTNALVADTVGRIADIRASTQGRDGVRAFLEKRKPVWLQ